MSTIPEPPDYGDVPFPGDDDIDHTDRFPSDEPHQLADDDDRPIPGLVTPEQVMAQHFELSKLPTVPSGFAALDVILDGMRPTQPYVLAAATGNGKTSFVLQLVTQYPGPVLIWTREMDPWPLQGRMVAQLSQTDSNGILRGEMPDSACAAYVAEFKDRVWYYSDASLQGFERVVARVVREASASGLDEPVLVVIDYLQKLARATDRVREAITEVSESIRGLTQKHQLITWIVSAVGREAARRIREQRDVHPGDLVDVGRESGSIEYDAAALLVLGLEPENAAGEVRAVISVAKNRYGRTGQVEYRFEGETGRFVELGRLESKAKREQRDLRERIRDVVSKADNPLSKNAINDKVTGRKATITHEIDAMVQDGELVRSGRGYVLGQLPDDDSAEMEPDA